MGRTVISEVAQAAAKIASVCTGSVCFGVSNNLCFLGPRRNMVDTIILVVITMLPARSMRIIFVTIIDMYGDLPYVS